MGAHGSKETQEKLVVPRKALAKEYEAEAVVHALERVQGLERVNGKTTVKAGEKPLFFDLTSDDIRSSIAQSRASDMRQPMTAYFIATSYRTYLTGSQVTSEASAEWYAAVLEAGCRCIQIDAWDGKDGMPDVTHGGTLCTRIKLEAVVKVIAEHAFTATPYPLIILLECHCSEAQQEKIATTFEKYIGADVFVKEREMAKGWIVPGSTFTTKHDTRFPPSPDQLRKRVLLNTMVRAHSLLGSANLVQSLADLTALPERKFYELQPIDDTQPMHYPSCLFTFKEAQMEKLAKNKHDKAERDAWRTHHMRFLAHVVPSKDRIDSSNQNPAVAWQLGAQLVALNYQVAGYPEKVEAPLFKMHKNGYVLKPGWMRPSGRG